MTTNRKNIKVEKVENGDVVQWRVVTTGGHKVKPVYNSPFNSFTEDGVPMDVIYSWMQKTVRSNWDVSHGYYLMSQIWGLYLLGGKGHMSRTLGRLATMLSEDLGAANLDLTVWGYSQIKECKELLGKNNKSDVLFKKMLELLMTMTASPCSGLAGTLNNVFIDMIPTSLSTRYKLDEPDIQITNFNGAYALPNESDDLRRSAAGFYEALTEKNLQKSAQWLGFLYWAIGTTKNRFQRSKKTAFLAWDILFRVMNRARDVDPIVRKNINTLFNIYKDRDDGRRERLHITHAMILLVLREKVPDQCVFTPVKFSEEQMVQFKMIHSTPRMIPDKVLDKHTRWGRAMDRSVEYFYNVSRAYWSIPDWLVYDQYEKDALLFKSGMKEQGITGARKKSGNIVIGKIYIDRYGKKLGDVVKKTRKRKRTPTHGTTEKKSKIE
jgi:hypothetical protein